MHDIHVNNLPHKEAVRDDDDADEQENISTGRETNNDVIETETENEIEEEETDFNTHEEAEDDQDDQDDRQTTSEDTQLNPKQLREMRQLGGWFNPEAQEILENRDVESGREIANLIDRRIDEFGFLAPTRPDDEDEAPESFQEAYNHPDPKKREKWRAAIRKEFHDMNARGVWRKIRRDNVPNDRRTVKCKWLFKIKRNGTYRARLVACGYSQIAGIDFSENYAPVINDITWRILIVAMLVWRLDASIVDVETAFLHGDLEEDIYMNCPEGMDSTEQECLHLLKSIYGLVQAARQWWKKFVKVLKDIGFKGGYSDPCLMTRRCSKGIVYIALYVDDCLCIGHRAAIEDTIAKIKASGLNVTVEDTLKDYLSCEISFSKDRKKAWLGQPNLIKKLEKKFQSLVSNLQTYRTPGTPGQGVMRPQTEEEKISEEDQSIFRTGVGTLLYLVKYSRPDIANPTRELSKVMDGANMSAFKEMKRIIKFVLDTKYMGLKIEPKLDGSDDWKLVVYCDSDYAGDKETRISVTGFIVYLLGVPISWKSKGQKSVTLSSSEAEFVALSEAAKEIKFIVQVLLSMGIPVKLPVIVRVDNVGAIFMAENVTTSSRTKHVDTRYHFVREFVEDKFIKIIFVRTKENDSDIFTKNVSGDIYDEHSKKFIANEDYLWKSEDHG